jgi:hypothetical protein
MVLAVGLDILRRRFFIAGGGAPRQRSNQMPAPEKAE